MCREKKGLAGDGGLAQGLGIGIQASRRWEPAVPNVSTGAGSKGALSTVAGEEGQGGFTISLACEWLGLLHLISSRIGGCSFTCKSPLVLGGRAPQLSAGK